MGFVILAAAVLTFAAVTAAMFAAAGARIEFPGRKKVTLAQWCQTERQQAGAFADAGDEA